MSCLTTKSGVAVKQMRNLQKGLHEVSILPLNMLHFSNLSFLHYKMKNCIIFLFKGNFLTLVVSATAYTSTLWMHTMSSAGNASFLTSKWKVPSFFLFLPRWHPLFPFRHHQKAEQDAQNLKNGPLRAARGSTDTIKEWYQLQIMHVSSLVLISCARNRTAQRWTVALQRPCRLNNALTLTGQGHLLTREMVKTRAPRVILI